MFLFLLTTYFCLLAASVTSLLWALSGQVFIVVLDMDAICLLRPLRQHSKHSPLPEAVAGFWVLPGLYRQTDLLPSPLCYPQSTNTTIFCLGNCSGPGFSPHSQPLLWTPSSAVLIWTARLCSPGRAHSLLCLCWEVVCTGLVSSSAS